MSSQDRLGFCAETDGRGQVCPPGEDCGVTGLRLGLDNGSEALRPRVNRAYLQVRHRARERKDSGDIGAGRDSGGEAGLHVGQGLWLRREHKGLGFAHLTLDVPTSYFSGDTK